MPTLVEDPAAWRYIVEAIDRGNSFEAGMPTPFNDLIVGVMPRPQLSMNCDSRKSLSWQNLLQKWRETWRETAPASAPTHPARGPSR
eukprot:COSAG06_NODE_3752_length_4945_cov_5.541478_2_plen_87_part_00